MYSKKNKAIYFEWDTISWARSLKIWNSYLEINRNGNALEIGSRRGGLSLMLAKEYDMKVVCSDLHNPETTAYLLHQLYRTKHQISYSSVDCTQIPYRDHTFDVVIIKSVIGALGTFEKQQKAYNEIFRVLNPGGVLLFAENLEASLFHMHLRKKFNRWSEYWRYPKLTEMDQLLHKFHITHIVTTGFFATCVRNSFLKTLISYFDLVIEPFIPKKNRYIVFGAAVKT
jgi:ubiquinone/menaquinone biosynthesis C-methylase UbiE